MKLICYQILWPTRFGNIGITVNLKCLKSMDISDTSKYSFPNKTSNAFSTSNLMEESLWLIYENYSSMKKKLLMPALFLTQLSLFNFNACEVTKVYSRNESSSDCSGSPPHFPGCGEGAQEHISVTLHFIRQPTQVGSKQVSSCDMSG